jgi:hypothetical protein
MSPNMPVPYDRPTLTIDPKQEESVNTDEEPQLGRLMVFQQKRRKHVRIVEELDDDAENRHKVMNKDNSVKEVPPQHKQKKQPQHSSNHRHYHNHHRSADTHERTRRYAYSAISATFFFVLLRELGWIDQIQVTLQEQTELIRRDNSFRETAKKDISSSMQNVASAAAKMAATSTLTQKSAVVGTASGPSNALQNLLMQASNTYLSRADMMEFVTQRDISIVPGSRPVMYTFFEYIPVRNRGTSMSDMADRALIVEWKAAWKAAGWHPIVLTLDDAKRHSQFKDYAEKVSGLPMLGVDGKGGAVLYNQLCFLRWLAVAATGGGFMSDYDVFPISRAPKQMEPPHGGNFTVYCKVKNSKRGGIPCLMSGRKDEWTRMAYAILENGHKNANNEHMWSDMLSVIDMRNTGAYTVYDAVLEGKEVLTKKGWTADDCDKTTDKHAIHFSHESMKLGYLAPGESAEDRPLIIRRFLTAWHQLCGIQTQDKVLG